MSVEIFLIFVGLCIISYLDYLTTIVAISHGAYESNPIIRWLLNKYDNKGLAWFKGILLCIVAISLPVVASEILLIVCGVELLVLMHNMLLIYNKVL